jgi:hypothetical protein
MAIADTLRSANGAQTVDSQKPDSELFSALMQRPVGFTSQDSPTSKDILSPALYDPLTHPEAIAQQKPYFEQAIKDASDNFDPKEVQAKTLRGAITGVDRKVSEGQQARADAIRGLTSSRRGLVRHFAKNKYLLTSGQEYRRINQQR